MASTSHKLYKVVIGHIILYIPTLVTINITLKAYTICTMDNESVTRPRQSCMGTMHRHAALSDHVTYVWLCTLKGSMPKYTHIYGCLIGRPKGEGLSDRDFIRTTIK